MSKAVGKSGRKFKNILINPSYQIRYLFWLTSTGLVLVTINSAIFYFYIRENYELLVELSPMTDEAKIQLHTELYGIVQLLIGTSAGFVLLVATIGLILSHRAAGPLFHFKRIFNLVTPDALNHRIRLRPNDEFKDAAAAFNSMMDRLENRKPKA